jgi:hypothetical protein
MIRHFCTLYYKVIILHSSCILRYWIWSCTWATVVWLVLVRTGPPCPHAHSRLILSLPSAGWTVNTVDAFSLFPTGTVWLLCPNLALGLQFLATHIYILYTQYYRMGYHTYTERGVTHIFVINHLDHTIGKGQSDLPFLASSIGHTNKVASQILNPNCHQSCESAENQFWRSTIAYPQLFSVCTSAIDSYLRNIVEVRTKIAYAPPWCVWGGVCALFQVCGIRAILK